MDTRALNSFVRSFGAEACLVAQEIILAFMPVPRKGTMFMERSSNSHTFEGRIPTPRLASLRLLIDLKLRVAQLRERKTR